MLLEHFATIEADFQRFYGINLPEAIWGSAPISCRRFLALVQGLPDDSALLSRAMHPHPERRGWGNTEELLALVAEVVHANYRLMFQVHAEPGTAIPDQLKIPRPGVELEKPRKASPEDLRQFFGGAVRYAPSKAGVA